MDANDYFKRGNAAVSAKDWERAIADFTEAIRLVPDNPRVAPVYNARGMAYYSKGDYDRAVGDFGEIIRLAPDNAKAYENRGKMYYHKKDYRRTIADFEKSLELAPDNAVLQENLAKIQARVSQVIDNLPVPPKVPPKTEPQNPEAQFQLAIRVQKDEDNKKADYWYAKAAEQGRGDARQGARQIKQTNISDKALVDHEASQFDGGMLELVGLIVLSYVITSVTLGIAAPWAVCNFYKWETEHTRIEGRKLQFTGTALGLFGTWIKWWFLSVITLGIYSLWVPSKLERWKVTNTSFVDRISDIGNVQEHQESQFDGGLLERIGASILGFLVTFFTLGIGAPWAMCMTYRWNINHTVIEGRRLQFTGTGGSLFGTWIKWWFLSVITLGIYSLWVPIKLEKWKVENTSFSDYVSARQTAHQQKLDEKKQIPRNTEEERKRHRMIAIIAGVCAGSIVLAIGIVSIVKGVINHAIDHTIDRVIDKTADVIDNVIDKTSSTGVIDRVIDKTSAGDNQSTSTISNTSAAQTYPEQPAFSPTHRVATNDGTNLRLRSSPSTKSEQIMSLPYGSSVQVLQTGDFFVDGDGNAGNWTYVATSEGGKGWCFGAYLKALGD